MTKIVGAAWTHYIWQGSQVIGEHDATTVYTTNPTYQVNSARVDYIYAGSRMISSRDRASSGGQWTTKSYLSDRLSTRLVMDASGNVLGRQAHLPFGEDFAVTGTQETHHFTSYERDVESGVDYAVNRMYALKVGRFQQADPYKGSAYAADAQSWNRYSYVQNDPIDTRDPLGLFPIIAPYMPVFLRPEYVDVSAGAGGGGFDMGGGINMDLSGGEAGGEIPVLPIPPPALSDKENRAISTALAELLYRLNFGQISDRCRKNVIDKLERAFGFNVGGFVRYLSGPSEFHDGTASHIPVAGNIMPRQPADLLYGAGVTISAVFENKPGLNAMTSITASSLTIYFRPGRGANGNPVIDLSSGGKNSHNLGLLFHEALHGFTGRVDEDLQSAFGLSTGPSSDITDYIRRNCF